MDWGDLRPLLEVARTGSLGAAARRLGVSTTTVGRRVEALEGALGLRLVDRQPDGAVLTPHGTRIVDVARGVEEQASAVDRLAAALRDDSTPAVRVSSTETVVTAILAPASTSFLTQHPTLRLELRATAEVVSLARRDADLAVRMTRPEGESLVARRLAPLELGLYASRVYLGSRRPAQIDLRTERLLGLDDSFGAVVEVVWFEQAGLAGAVRFRTSSPQALLAAVRAGAGIALLPRALTIGDRSLVALPDGGTPFPVRTPWLVTHRDLRQAAPVRAASRWIVETFEQLGAARRDT